MTFKNGQQNIYLDDLLYQHETKRSIDQHLNMLEAWEEIPVQLIMIATFISVFYNYDAFLHVYINSHVHMCVRLKPFWQHLNTLLTLPNLLTTHSKKEEYLDREKHTMQIDEERKVERKLDGVMKRQRLSGAREITHEEREIQEYQRQRHFELTDEARQVQRRVNRVRK